MEIKILEELGLSKREAETYLTLLELGTTTIGSIIQKTNIPSSKIYEILARLSNKGLVTHLTIKHQKHFQASDPEMILHYYEERKEQFMKILPILKEKQTLVIDKQEVELYEGKIAIFSMLRFLIEQAKKGDEYLSFSLGIEHKDPEISLFLTNLARRRKEKGLKIKVLSSNKNRKIIEQTYSKEVLKMINNKFTNLDYPQGIIILNDNYIILDWENKFTAIKIKSKNITDKYRKFFYDVYDGSVKLINACS